MRIIAITFLVLCSLTARAEEYLIWNKLDGSIKAHGQSIDISGKVVKCGENRFGNGVNRSNLSAGTVAVWVKDAKNISELGSVTTVGWSDIEVDYDTWTPKEKAMLKVLVKEINTLRTNAGLPARTKSQVMTALKAEL